MSTMAAFVSVRIKAYGIGHTAAADPLPGVPVCVGPACAVTT
jgi:hypothetical protein